MQQWSSNESKWIFFQISGKTIEFGPQELFVNLFINKLSKHLKWIAFRTHALLYLAIQLKLSRSEHNEKKNQSFYDQVPKLDKVKISPIKEIF